MPIHLEARQSSVLEAIIREYIRTAEPVGSLAVVERHNIAVSPATIRNDMTELEEAGFIRQPHTSAGRVPTVMAYQYYVENFMRDVAVPHKEEMALQQIWSLGETARAILKLTAKIVASFSEESVFLAFDKHDVYYTGIANLFSQPEFSDRRQIQNISSVIDRLDEAAAEIYESVTDDIRVFIGEKDYFGRQCSVIAARYEVTKDGKGIFGLLGPIRMDYEMNIARLKYVRYGVKSNRNEV